MSRVGFEPGGVSVFEDCEATALTTQPPGQDIETNLKCPNKILSMVSAYSFRKTDLDQLSRIVLESECIKACFHRKNRSLVQV